MLGFATSAVRDAANSDDVLAHVARRRPASTIDVLSGEDEARLTFLAVRRWFGWSPAGWPSSTSAAARSRSRAAPTRRPTSRGRCRWARPGWPASASPDGPPDEDDLRALRKQIRAEIARDAGNLLRAGAPDRAGGDLEDVPFARPASAARRLGRRPAGPASARRRRPRELDPEADRDDARGAGATCPASRPAATHQIVPGALVAEAVHGHLRPAELEICPWALREGVILERLDQIGRCWA